MSINKPFDLEHLERDLLSLFLISRDIWLRYKNDIKEEYFKDQDFGHIFILFKIYYDKYKEIPTKDQTKQLIKKSKFDNEEIYPKIDNIYLKQEFRKDEVEYLNDQISNLIKFNKVGDVLYSSVDKLENADYFSILDELKQAIYWEANIDLGMRLKNNIDERYESVNRIYEGLIKTPWESLNQKVEGFFKKELFNFASLSSVGKSLAMAQSALYSYLQGYNVVYITLELSEERVGVRMDVSATGVPTPNLLHNHQEAKNFYQNLQNKNNEIYIKEFPTGAITTEYIEEYLFMLELHDNFKPDIVFVDYGDILLPKKAYGDLYRDGGGVFENLRGMAQTLNISVVSATQINRSAMNIRAEDLNEGTIADSWKKMMISDTIIALVSVPEQRARGELDMKIMKNRSGEKDTILPFNVEYELFRINAL